MIKEEEVYPIGIVNKPHGTRGEVQFTLTDDAYDAEENDMEFIFCKLDGILVPFFVEEYRYKSDNSLLLKLEGIDTEEQARRLTNVEAFVEEQPALSDEDELTWGFFRGCTAEDVNAGTLGKISEVDTSTVNTLFIIEQGDNELLIPAQEEFIVSIDRKKRHLTLSLPEGLLTLNHPDKAGEEVY